MQIALLLLSLMFVLLAAAIMLWRISTERRRRRMNAEFIERQLQRQAGSSPAQLAAAQRGRARTGFALWDRILLRAGRESTASLYLSLFGPVVVLPMMGWLLVGDFLAMILLLISLAQVWVRLWYAIDKRRRRMVAQLPGLLENMVRLVMIGNSMPAAFQSSVAALDSPLKDVMERAAAINRSGKELDVALTQVSRQYGLVELQLVAAVVSIALRFGGRSDQVLERMAGFMRDLDQARAELIAMSAEVRLSGWILALLPLGVAAFLVSMNSALFLGMWNDASGFKMMMLAIGLQCLGCWWLYRMARGV
jgi:tight adherence protein B